jgi:hypothetical protein
MDRATGLFRREDDESRRVIQVLFLKCVFPGEEGRKWLCRAENVRLDRFSTAKAPFDHPNVDFAKHGGLNETRDGHRRDCGFGGGTGSTTN